MASVWIRPRTLQNGRVRHLVYYRLGGRGSRETYAGSFGNLSQAERHCEHLRSEIAACRLLPTKLARAERPRVELVYFAQLGELVKIGVSIAPDERTRRLNAELLHVESGGRERERELHSAFDHLRVTGEWFRDDVRIRRYLASRARAPEAVQTTEGKAS